MIERQQNLKKILREDLIKLMEVDKSGTTRAQILALGDIVDTFREKYPNAAVTKALNKFPDMAPTEQGLDLYQGWIVNNLKLDFEAVQAEILKTYANQNGYLMTDL